MRAIVLKKYIFVATIGQVYAVAGTKVEVPSGWPAGGHRPNTHSRGERLNARTLLACERVKNEPDLIFF